MKAQIEQLEKENKTLKEKLSEITMLADDEKQSIEHILELEEENRKLKEYNRRLKQGNEDLKEQNKKLKETIKDHQLYEEKLEHRIIELEELLH